MEPLYRGTRRRLREIPGRRARSIRRLARSAVASSRRRFDELHAARGRGLDARAAHGRAGERPRSSTRLKRRGRLAPPPPAPVRTQRNEAESSVALLGFHALAEVLVVLRKLRECCKMKTVSRRKIARHVRLARSRLPWCVTLSVIGLALVSVCPPSAPAVGRADLSIKHDLFRGVRAIRVTHDRNKLHLELVRLLAIDARTGRRRVHGGGESSLFGGSRRRSRESGVSSTSARTTAGRSPPPRGTQTG